MRLIFTADFTMYISVYTDGSNIANLIFKIPSDELIEDMIHGINEFLINEPELTEVIFVGQHKAFRELESYFKNENKEIKILWQ